MCGSDVFLQDGGFVGSPVPIVPGHEAAGVVDAIGSGVTDLEEGQVVALYYLSTPPGDAWTLAGDPNRSPSVARMGVDVDGAFAEYVIRPRECVIVPAGPLPVAELALLTDAVATPLHGLRRVAKVEAGETVAVIGIGGIGSNAVQLAKAFGATVIAISRSEERLRLARKLGADHTVVSRDDTAMRRSRADRGARRRRRAPVRRLRPAYQLAVDIAGPGGRVVFIGSSADAVQVQPMRLIWAELALLGSRGFVPADIEEAIALRLDGRISLDHLGGSSRPLEEAQEALDDLRAGRVLRTVLLP